MLLKQFKSFKTFLELVLKKKLKVLHLWKSFVLFFTDFNVFFPLLLLFNPDSTVINAEPSK